jgi:hypothetical protein
MVGHMAMEAMRNAHKILVKKPEGIGRHRHRWQDNIKMDVKEIVYEGVDWINVAQDRDQC